MSSSVRTFPDGIILLDKKEGFTSMASDNYVKRLSGTGKVGHSGTLDPFATGLLPIFVGKALKFMRYTDDYDKAYDCTCCFGIKTDSMDLTGEQIGGRLPTSEELNELISTDFKLIRDAFKKVSQKTTQTPPKYSAKKINGRKAYELVREGKEVELKPHNITIYSLTINEIKVVDGLIYVDFSTSCSKGTYIRTICDDVGDLTGFGAHAASLRRTNCGPFSVGNAVTEENLKALCEAGDYSFVIDATEAMSQMPRIELNANEYKDVLVGKKIRAIEGTKQDVKYAAFYEGKIAAVLYRVTEQGKEIMRIERMLASND